MTDLTYNLNGGFKPTTKRFADLSGPDFFPTPPWATFALIDNEKFSGEIWECACGDGSMSRVLKQTGQPVHSSDLYDRGYGEVGVDFLHATRTADNIVTNPPYNCAEGFVASGFRLANRKFALLLRFVWDKEASPGRTELKWFEPGYKAKFAQLRHVLLEAHQVRGPIRSTRPSHKV